MTYKLSITFQNPPYVSMFLNKLKCDDISCQIELYTPKVEELFVTYIGFKPEDKAVKDTIIKIAYSCGAVSVKEVSRGRSSNKCKRKDSSGSITISPCDINLVV